MRSVPTKHVEQIAYIGDFSGTERLAISCPQGIRAGAKELRTLHTLESLRRQIIDVFDGALANPKSCGKPRCLNPIFQQMFVIAQFVSTGVRLLDGQSRRIVAALLHLQAINVLCQG
jgi:hypothetical protein